jgi:hypothetical protein
MQDLSKNKWVTYCVIVNWSVNIKLLCENYMGAEGEGLSAGDLVYLLGQSVKLLLFHEMQLGSGCPLGDLYYRLECGYVEPFTSKLRY